MTYEDILDRQRRAPQYFERVAAVRKMLAERHVHPDIIERVLRLNPVLRECERLRGIHYKEGRWCGLMIGAIQKGEFLRRYGRDAFATVPKEHLIKRGRRVWISLRYSMGLRA